MKEFKYAVTDPNGIHARPAIFLVQKAKTFSSDIQIGIADKMVDAKRILSVMGLCIKFNQEVIVTADGEDENEAIRALEEFLKAEL